MSDNNTPEWRERNVGWFYSTERCPRTNLRRSYGLVVPQPGRDECSWVAYLPDGGMASGCADTLEKAMQEVEKRAKEARTP